MVGYFFVKVSIFPKIKRFEEKILTLRLNSKLRDIIKKRKGKKRKEKEGEEKDEKKKKTTLFV